MPGSFSKPLKYLSIAATIRERIAAGVYVPGQQLPASAALAKEHGVALMTVRQALGILQQEGAIEARHGAGTFVADTAKGGARKQTRRVLLTEDDPTLCNAVAAALQAEGFDVEVAYSGGEALSKLDAVEDFDAIVLDLRLPDTDGFEIVDFIKANRPALRVIVASGYVDSEDILTAAERWPLMLLRKPYSAEELVERLHSLMRPRLRATQPTAEAGVRGRST
jgi:CheY-like chemotaxis protein